MPQGPTFLGQYLFPIIFTSLESHFKYLFFLIFRQFDDEGLTDDVENLSPSDYLGLEEWINFYHKDYTYVGKLAGRFFNMDGTPTDYYRKLQQWMSEAKEDAQSKETEKKIFPPCNSEWSADKGEFFSIVKIFFSDFYHI